MEKPEIELRAADVPEGYAVCYNQQCPRAVECLRYRCYTVLPEREEVRPCVLPQACQGDKCRRFVEARPVQLAWGMSRLFDDVPAWQAMVIRHELMHLFNSRTTFFRYRRGEFVITPQQQKAIADIFARYGFTKPRRYDYMRLAYYFDVPGFGSSHTNSTRTTKERLQNMKRKFQEVP